MLLKGEGLDWWILSVCKLSQLFDRNWMMPVRLSVSQCKMKNASLGVLQAVNPGAYCCLMVDAGCDYCVRKHSLS